MSKDKTDVTYGELLQVLKKRDLSAQEAATVVLFLFDNICRASGVDTVSALRTFAVDLEHKRERN